MLKAIVGLLVLIGAPVIGVLILLQLKLAALILFLAIGLFALYVEARGVFFDGGKPKDVESLMDSAPYRLMSGVKLHNKVLGFVATTTLVLVLWPVLYGAVMLRRFMLRVRLDNRLAAMAVADNVWTSHIFISLYMTAYFTLTHMFLGHAQSEEGRYYVYALVVNNGIALLMFVVQDIKASLRRQFGSPQFNYILITAGSLLLSASSCLLLLPIESQSYANFLASIDKLLVSKSSLEVSKWWGAISTFNDTTIPTAMAEIQANGQYYAFSLLFYGSFVRAMWSVFFDRKALQRSNEDRSRLILHRMIQGRWSDAQHEIDRVETPDMTTTMMQASVQIERGLVETAIETSGRVATLFGRQPDRNEAVMRIVDSAMGFPNSEDAIQQFMNKLPRLGVDPDMICSALLALIGANRLSRAFVHDYPKLVDNGNVHLAAATLAGQPMGISSPTVMAFLNDEFNARGTVRGRVIVGMLIAMSTDSADALLVVYRKLRALLPALIAECQRAALWKNYTLLALLNPVRSNAHQHSYLTHLPVELRSEAASLHGELAPLSDFILQQLGSDQEYRIRTAMNNLLVPIA